MALGHSLRITSKKKAMSEEIAKERKKFEEKGIDNSLVSDGGIEAMIMRHEYPDGWAHTFKKGFSDSVEENPPVSLGMHGRRGCAQLIK